MTKKTRYDNTKYGRGGKNFTTHTICTQTFKEWQKNNRKETRKWKSQ